MPATFQPGRLMLDDVKDALAKFAHQLLGKNGADALHHATAQVFFDAFLGGRRGAGQHLGFELEAELAVLDPAAFRRHPFTGADGRQGADHRHQVALALGFDFEHGIAVFLIEERDALDQPGEAFGELFGRLRLQFTAMMGRFWEGARDRPRKWLAQRRWTA